MSKYNYSKLSLKRIAECHPDLQAIAMELIKEMDVTVLCGHRGQADQDAAVKRGASRLKWPKSKHNKMPSLAIDTAPWPIAWKNIPKFDEMCNRIQKIADRLGIKIRQGRSFSFKDYPHTELVNPRPVATTDKK
jgi:peptidoglycan L-alanyl-D-glutamate endopeptidase CwlK